LIILSLAFVGGLRFSVRIVAEVQSRASYHNVMAEPGGSLIVGQAMQDTGGSGIEKNKFPR
jgi:hypothetical protein